MPIKAESLMTPEEAAAYLRVEESTVKQWAKLGKIPHRRAGSLIRFERDELDDWTKRGGADAVEGDAP